MFIVRRASEESDGAPYGSVQTLQTGTDMLSATGDNIPGGMMAYLQFQQELKHLEYIVPRLARDSPLGLVYWASRVTSLSTHPGLCRNDTVRVTRLLKLFAAIERMSELTTELHVA